MMFFNVMKSSYLSIIYFFLGFLSCVCSYFELDFLAIIIRWASLIFISLVYYLKEKNVLFPLSILVVGIAETLLIHDFANYLKGVIIFYTFSVWFVFWVLRDNINNSINNRIIISRVFPIIISVCLIVYLFLEVLTIVTPFLKDNLMYGYILTVSILMLFGYIGFVYVTNHNQRYVWLLFLLISIVLTTLLGSIEFLYYHNFILEQFVYIVQIVSHYLFYRFLIEKEEDVIYF